MVDHIFRQYDIRGKIGSELPLNEVYDLTKAIIVYFKKKNPNLKTVAVGADGRTHSPEFKKELCRAIQDSGVDVLFIGHCPSPVLYFSLFNLDVDGGLMITASHNGPEYNGIKICLGRESVWGDEIQEIKKNFHEHKNVRAESPGSYREYPVINDYIAWIKNHFNNLVGMDLKAIIDCGNGAGGYILPALVKAMEWKNVKLLCEEVDGTYPNHEADPIVEKNMQDVKKALQNSDLEVGLGLDGDCDRMTPMTKEGELVQGDKLLSLFAQQIIESHPNAKIVFDIKCSSGLPELITQWGATPIISPSGHSIIKDQMKRHHAALAGELSCHFFFNDRYFGYDDGIYAACRLFEIITQSGKTLHQLLEMFPKKFSTPEFRIECDEQKKDAIVDEVKKIFAARIDTNVLDIDGIRVTMEYGWGILRSSNTQSVLCLRFEGDSPQGLEKVRDDFVNAIKPYYDQEFLNQTFYAK